MERRLWTREESIVVFNLYCKIPFNKSSKFHPEVIKVANLINRTPSAVNMKIGNITWNIGEEASYLKESDYSDFFSSLGDIGTSLDSTKDSTDALIGSGGGLSAEALNFDGFSPLFEMGYNVSRNLSTASAAISEIKSVIEADAKNHMTAEWGTHLQKANEHLEELEVTTSMFVYEMAHESGKITVVLNLGENEIDFNPQSLLQDSELVVSNYKDVTNKLRPYESLVIKGK